jgi:hypothetical protein
MKSEPTRYQVRGRWPFPIDMMRRDGAIAATPEDVIAIESLSGETAPDMDRHTVHLVCMDPPNRFWQPNIERWRSYGWTVIVLDGAPVRDERPEPEPEPAAAAIPQDDGRMDQYIARMMRTLVATQVALLELESGELPRPQAEKALDECLEAVAAARAAIRRFRPTPQT